MLIVCAHFCACECMCACLCVHVDMFVCELVILRTYSYTHANICIYAASKPECILKCKYILNCANTIVYVQHDCICVCIYVHLHVLHKV